LSGSSRQLATDGIEGQAWTVDDFVLAQSEQTLAPAMQDVGVTCRACEKEDAAVALLHGRHVRDLEREVVECAALDVDRQRFGGRALKCFLPGTDLIAWISKGRPEPYWPT